MSEKQKKNTQSSNRRPTFTVQDEIRRDRRIRRAGQFRRARTRARRFMTALLCVAVCVLLVVAVAVAVTRVQTVSVSGNMRYTDNELLTASNAVGEILPLLREDTVYDRIAAMCPYVESVTLVKTYPTTLEIIVTETEAVYTAYARGRQMSLDAGLRVMDYTENTEGLILLELPEIQSALEGSRLVFAEEGSDTFVNEMLALFFAEGKTSLLTALDLTDRYAISGRVGDSAKIVFGDYKNIAVKLELAEQILADAAAEQSSRTLIDVSEPSRASAQYDYTGTFD